MPKINDIIKVDFFIEEQMLAFDASPNMVREVKSLFPNFKQIASRCFKLINTRFLYKKRFYKQHQAEICKKNKVKAKPEALTP